jgi:photosystem II stability/assembly factor-like uncharacterized protein
MAERVFLLVGTRKGGFIYTADRDRRGWQLSQPFLPGWSVYHAAADLRRERPRLLAAANHWAWGASVARSDDLGQSWEQKSEGLAFPSDMDLKVENVWHVSPGPADMPGLVLAGASPGGLFRSEDAGETWTPVEGIVRHPFRSAWIAAPGGPMTHSILFDPRDSRRLYASISAGGSYASSDGGQSWELLSHTGIDQSEETKAFMSQVAANVPPDVDPAAAFDMHCVRLDTKNPDRLWAQAHTGVFRSDDKGKTWKDVTGSLPSHHGFPIAISRRDPDSVYVVPLEFESNNFRVCPGQLTVYRTRDAAESWQPLTNGLPGPDDYQSVYREGLSTDGLDPEGVYVGTSNGQVYASSDGGDSWQRLPGTLPPVLSVTAAVIDSA